MTLLDTLAATIAHLPDDASVSLPVGWLRSELESEDVEPSRAIADLTLEELGEELNRSPSTLRGWLAEGRLEGAYKLNGREWRIPRSAVRRFLDGQANTGPALGKGRDPLAEWRRSHA